MTACTPRSGRSVTTSKKTMNNEAKLVRGIVVAHAGLAEALVDSVRSIAAPAEDALVAVSNVGLGPDAIGEAIQGAMGPEPTIVFSDLPTGSCGIAARRIGQDREAYAMVCGVNLPILLDFVTHRDMPLQELIERLVERGHRSIAAVPATSSGHAGGAVSG